MSGDRLTVGEEDNVVSSQTPREDGGRSPGPGASTRHGRGWMFVELISHLERSMHEAAHVFPAVDHLARQPPRPTAADSERIKALLATEVSVGLRDAFERWCACERQFLDAAARLGAVRKHEAGAAYQSELERDIAALRTTRAELLRAAEELRARVARELDA